MSDVDDSAGRSSAGVEHPGCREDVGCCSLSRSTELWSNTHTNNVNTNNTNANTTNTSTNNTTSNYIYAITSDNHTNTNSIDNIDTANTNITDTTNNTSTNDTTIDNTTNNTSTNTNGTNTNTITANNTNTHIVVNKNAGGDNRMFLARKLQTISTKSEYHKVNRQFANYQCIIIKLYCSSCKHQSIVSHFIVHAISYKFHCVLALLFLIFSIFCCQTLHPLTHVIYYLCQYK
ncbi:unnamed protein product [Schistosoma margrebowiei]|uniref:Uncharacterized protein n=1 Tax=Schistosoma margrebowiei TaxID=48269 RepID=A0A183LZN4_9TREM|nr:unnamed protein product [Schistosoma margrebowiei]